IYDPMVCSIGSGKMAAMARLLGAGSFSYAITEEVNSQKLAAQSVHRLLRDVDEANLLDEKDMHVFDWQPMTDPLNLVCCNACKKPIKTSQYAVHAELCKSLKSTEEIASELDGGAGHKKPPRKERKKSTLTHAKQALMTGEQERPVSVNAEDITLSGVQSDEQVGMTSAPMKAKDVAFKMDSSGVSLENTKSFGRPMPPPRKRSKSIAAGVQQSDDIETACGLPAPLATKLYYSQRNHRLRSAFSHIYFDALPKEHHNDPASSKLLGHEIVPLLSTPNDISSEQMIYQPEMKGETNNFTCGQQPEQILIQTSEACLTVSGECPTVMTLTNHSVNNALKLQFEPAGMMRNMYLPKPRPFGGSSGKLGSIQQLKGSVPVV
ncbi:hypothetical protein RJ641_004196, partial [Dillenia turbinata]